MKPESLLQSQIVAFIRRCCPQVMVVGSMNGMIVGGTNKFAQIAHHKKLGLIPGFPDLQLFWNGLINTQGTTAQLPRVLLLEIKSPKGKVSDVQASVMADLTNKGFPCEVVRDWVGFERALSEHNVPTIARKA